MLKKLLMLFSFSYPFNYYGFYNKIIFPKKTQKFLKKISKNIFLQSWDLCQMPELVFNMFEEFCNNYPFHFVEQWSIQQKDYGQYQYAFEKSSLSEEEYFNNILRELEPYRELESLRKYVYVRKTNWEKYKYITDVVLKNSTFRWEVYKENEKLKELKIDQKKYYSITYWFDYDVLCYKLKEVETKEEEKSDWHFIEDDLIKMDQKHAAMILNYACYIWD